MNRIKWLGHEINENGNELNEENVEAILKLKPSENTKRVEIISRGNTIYGKIPTKKSRNKPTDYEDY